CSAGRARPRKRPGTREAARRRTERPADLPGWRRAATRRAAIRPPYAATYPCCDSARAGADHDSPASRGPRASRVLHGCDVPGSSTRQVQLAGRHRLLDLDEAEHVGVDDVLRKLDEIRKRLDLGNRLELRHPVRIEVE